VAASGSTTPSLGTSLSANFCSAAPKISSKPPSWIGIAMIATSTTM
jgi:hypothetical protein